MIRAGDFTRGAIISCQCKGLARVTPSSPATEALCYCIPVKGAGGRARILKQPEAGCSHFPTTSQQILSLQGTGGREGSSLPPAFLKSAGSNARDSLLHKRLAKVLPLSEPVLTWGSFPSHVFIQQGQFSPFKLWFSSVQRQPSRLHLVTLEISELPTKHCDLPWC